MIIDRNTRCIQVVVLFGGKGAPDSKVFAGTIRSILRQLAGCPAATESTSREVRVYVGDDRVDTDEMLRVMNDLNDFFMDVVEIQTGVATHVRD